MSSCVVYEEATGRVEYTVLSLSASHSEPSANLSGEPPVFGTRHIPGVVPVQTAPAQAVMSNQTYRSSTSRFPLVKPVWVLQRVVTAPPTFGAALMDRARSALTV